MNISGYTIDFDAAINQIKKKSNCALALQLPEGLKSVATRLANYLEEHAQCTVYIIADPCFGACDLADAKLSALPIDLILQVGHLPIPLGETGVPTLFVTAKVHCNLSKISGHLASKLIGKNIGIVTTAQYLHLLPELKKYLQNHGFTPVIRKGDTRVAAEGHILGCNYSSATSIAAEVDSFVYLGSGMFHPLGVALATTKPVITADPATGKIQQKELEELKDATLRQRYGAIVRSKSAKIFGILIGLKPGQQRMKIAESTQRILTSQKKQSYLLFIDCLSPEILDNFKGIDCFVSTACPRLAIDDYARYNTPVLTPVELEIALGLKSWDDYHFDEITS